MTSAKPFEISKRRVLEAYRHVRANQGAAGIDDESIEMFEADLSRNLYTLWNRMASGSYFPPPVKQVEIAKKSGDGQRVLGIPTVADRIARQVVKARIEGELEGLFHPDSYGYRLKKSAADAVAVTRERCWKYDWCVEFKALTDTELVLGSAIPHEHDLVLGYYSVHTSPDALRDGEAHISSIKKRLLQEGRL